MCLYSEVQENSNMKKNKKEHTKKHCLASKKNQNKQTGIDNSLHACVIPDMQQIHQEVFEKMLQDAGTIARPNFEGTNENNKWLETEMQGVKKQGVSCRT